MAFGPRSDQDRWLTLSETGVEKTEDWSAEDNVVPGKMVDDGWGSEDDNPIGRKTVERGSGVSISQLKDVMGSLATMQKTFLRECQEERKQALEDQELLVEKLTMLNISSGESRGDRDTALLPPEMTPFGVPSTPRPRRLPGEYRQAEELGHASRMDRRERMPSASYDLHTADYCQHELNLDQLNPTAATCMFTSRMNVPYDHHLEPGFHRAAAYEPERVS